MSDLDSQALSIVEQCLDLEAEERDLFVASRCAGAPELESKVRHILTMEGADDPFSTRLVERRHDVAGAVPERIGKFRVTGLIGHGGMGTVVRAERDDGLYAHCVAIKSLRTGLRDERARERFANERRLLARLNHPGIARILDGGEQDGRPYLVMELVEGLPVTKWLKSQAASTEQRLDALQGVAEAVSHAHRNLVIHGDLKPSNILCTADGSVKLLDFGIGRLTGTLEGEGTAYPLTPRFAAPEREQGAPPTIASDVYSLGILLKLMLEAPLPSDLEFIAAKATASDPEQRYPDVAGLQADLRRYREHRPVHARPRRFSYVATRFLRRNRLGVAIGSAFIMLLAAAAIVSTFLYLDSQRQRQAAVARFEQLRALAKFQLFELYDRLAETPGTTAARARLAAEAQHYLDSLAAISGAPDELRLDVARGLDRLASVQGVPRIANLGRPGDARRNLARAAAILDALPNTPQVAAERARNRVLRAQMATWIDFRTDEAQALLGEARVPEGIDPAEALELEAYRRSARLDVMSWNENYAELRRAAAADRAWLSRWPEPRPVAWAAAMADSLNARGDARFYLGDQSGALDDYRAADRLLTAAAGRRPRQAALLARRMISGYNIASAMMEGGERDGLLPFTRDLLARAEALVALEPNDEALRRRQTIIRDLVAQVLDSVGRRDEAIAQQRLVVAERAALAQRRGTEPRVWRDLAFSQSVLGTLSWNSGNRAGACSAWREAADGLEKLAQAGQLSAFDREHSLAYLRRNVDICGGRFPPSAYRPPA